MALVVFFRGVNVGGHRSFRPSVLAKQLERWDAVNVGAAGTLVIRRPPAAAVLRAELARRLPFVAEIVVCQGRDVVRLAARKFFSGYPERRDVVRFVSVLSKLSRSAPTVPLSLPPQGRWMVKVLARQGRFVVGLYRREMKVIGHLGRLDRVFGAPVTTRSWKTIAAIAEVLKKKP